jgi:glycosyltransferase involved in cell wall biosynthesis
MLSVIALLGKRDAPTDGLEDYCTFLGEGLLRRGVKLEKVRVDWHQRGWMRSFLQLWRESGEWRGKWVVLQFTSLAWSRRGFPFAAWVAVMIVRGRGARTGVVYHEPKGGSGPRWIDRLRSFCQEWVIRQIYNLAEKPIFADPLETVLWLPRGQSKAVFIPIGANIPEPTRPQTFRAKNGQPKTVAVYCLSDPPHRGFEIEDISRAIQNAAENNGEVLRLVFMGRGTPEAKDDIERAFTDIRVELLNLGIQPAEEVSRILARADVMLCVRGRLFPRRGSALAGIACGVPVVAYAGASEGSPLEDAGVELVGYRDIPALSKALSRILNDRDRWQALHVKSLRANEKYFSWDTIAASFIDALQLKDAWH